MIKINRKRQIKKNINNNLNFYKSSANETGKISYNFLTILCIAMLAISTAAMSILGAVGILSRIPDFFKFEFDRTEIYKKLDLGISGSDLGSFFSKFMTHKYDEFKLVIEYDGETKNIFNNIDATMMDNLRNLLDILLVCTVIAWVIMVFLIIIMQFNRMSRSLRTALNISLGIYLIVVGGLALFLNVFDGDKIFVNSLLNEKWSENDLLPQMFEARFTLNATITAVVISFIIMMIVRYIVWRLTAQKGIFSEGLKGIAK